MQPKIQNWAHQNIDPKVSEAKQMWQNADVQGKWNKVQDFAKAKWGQLTQKELNLMSLYDRCSCQARCFGSASCIAAFNGCANPADGPWAEGYNGMYEEDSLQNLDFWNDFGRGFK